MREICSDSSISRSNGLSKREFWTEISGEAQERFSFGHRAFGNVQEAFEVTPRAALRTFGDIGGHSNRRAPELQPVYVERQGMASLPNA